ncbi:hypothetical protein AS594_16115 [Streptomyces agglomeratus]|uniref:TadE-like domain-containing protein n=1 Tax=Streptomyces agglomeratus TaxID=285458 RepID=A0A1E5P8C7_9ACTN|nr:TadE family type IV pilus minor pilin [Streptomyces agglomeratus]OEJ25792.1 hypothetical protein AS594_16115 [Streptomyces agglomeratus]OEJ40167.1 hypothetical protein BGK70_20385 [Streptomyces agglomeratus]OEJ52714.1 hypothetical protein BGK72_20000 [Streptomyces agglomeratus]
MSPSEAGRRTDRGYVTAEAAVVVPALVLFAMTLVWALVATLAQIQCVDAARAGARAAARQEPQAAPRGARVTISRDGSRVRVAVEAPAPGLGALSLTLRAEAVAPAEESVGVAV